MPVERIEYTAWEGQKSSRLRRIYAIVKKIFRDKLSSKGILILLILLSIVGHALPLISSSLAPHEALTPKMMAKIAEDPMTGGGYLNNLVLFSLLFASVVCSDLISRDLRDNSFTLYKRKIVRSP